MLQPFSKHSDFSLSPIKAIELAAAQMTGVISLAQGIPSFRTPKVIIDFVQERIASGACDKYSLTTGLPEFREEVAIALQSEGLQYDPDTEILATAGSIEGISATLLALISSGDEVIIPSPTYTSYQNCIKLAGGIPVFVELDEERNFDLDISKIADAITRKTKAIFYCNPNNPTGTIFSRKATEELLSLAEKHDLYLITDEVYKDFYYTDDLHCSPALLPGGRERVIRICSFSKAFAMTGWRIGFLHTSSQLLSKIVGYHDTLVTCAPVASQYAGIGAIRYGDQALQEFREEFTLRRNYAIEILDQMSDVMDYQLPKASYFVFPRIKDTVQLSDDSTRLAYDILEKARVAVVPGVAFGPSGESHLRINFGRTSEDLRVGMERLADYFSDKRRGKSTKKTIFTALPGERPKGDSLYHRLIKSTLAFAARRSISKSKPIVIGIVGLQGKTTVKRTIASLLNEEKRTRAGMLSYNTGFGLPLSILGIKSPVGFTERLTFIKQYVIRLISPMLEEEVLVLEYGITNTSDAAELLQCAQPDWLVITELTASETIGITSEFLDGLLQLVAKTTSEQIVWVDSEALRREKALNRKLSPDSMLQLHDGAVSKYYPTISEEFTPAGRGALTGLHAAVFLAKKLGLREETVEEWIKKERSQHVRSNML